MKKILSLVLAALLLFSMIPTAMAADTNPASEGTTISVTGTKGATYEVTVPATLSPGQTGTVTASGTWAANQTLTVTCPTSVNLVNGSDTIPVSVEFGGIAEAGNDNGDAENATANITVGNVDMSAYFGTWTGHLSYTVELVTEEATVAMYSYNGVELPDINTVWTDEVKAEYPYAILRHDPTDKVVLVVASTAFTYHLYDGNEWVATNAASKWQTFILADSGQAFTKVYEGDSDNTLSVWSGDAEETIFWTNTDITHWTYSEGYLPNYLSASDPVPVS